MLGLWRKLHKSISGDALQILRVKSAVLLIVSFGVQRFICVPRKSHNYSVIIVSRCPNEPSSI